MRKKSIIIILFLLSALRGAQTEQDPNLFRAISIPHPLTVALRDASVLQEIQLRPEQMESVTALIDQIDLPLWRLRDLPPEQRFQKGTILVQQLRENLARILTRRQLKRLNQIVWQLQGITSFLRPDMTKRLQLSAHQLSQIENAFTDLTNQLKQLQQTPNLTEQSRNSSIREIQAQTQKDIRVILNTKQRKILPQLLGPPCDLSHVRLIACKAPPLQPVTTWINTDNPQTLAQHHGKVIVVHFYAFGCINCKHTLPYYNQWVKDFPADQFQIIGIHRPETKKERNLEKVKARASEYHMEYPIAVDNQSLNWNTWANNIWPSMYLVDKNGFVRYWWYGELNYQGAPSEKWMRDKINELLKEDVSVSSP